MLTNKYNLLKIIYDTAIADIKFIKEQQWKITNYGFLLFASIYSSLILIADNPRTEKYIRDYKDEIYIFVCILIFLIWSVSVWFLYNSNKDFEMARDRVKRCNEKFGSYYMNVLKPREEKEKKIFTKYLITMYYLILFLVANLIIFLSRIKIISV